MDAPLVDLKYCSDLMLVIAQLTQLPTNYRFSEVQMRLVRHICLSNWTPNDDLANQFNSDSTPRTGPSLTPQAL